MVGEQWNLCLCLCVSVGVGQCMTVYVRALKE